MAKEKVKKPIYKKWWFWLLAVIIVGSLATGGEEEATEKVPVEEASEEPKEEKKAEKPKEEKKEAPKAAAIGETATVADVGFTVNAVEELTEIKQEFGDPVTTDGKFVIAEVSINNGQKEALTIDSSYFKIKTADGVEYEPATDGEVIMAMSMNGEDDFFLQQVNPGMSKTGKVVFEVPADMDLTKTVLHCQTGLFGTETIEIKLSK